MTHPKQHPHPTPGTAPTGHGVDDPGLERLLDRIELVPSRGDPARHKLCIMSLVARLAEEAHSDSPLAASPLIAAFARPVNDAMDRQTRQRLIPFAPRILGTTADGDPGRQQVLHATLMESLLPRIVTDLQAGARPHVEAEAVATLSRLAAALAETPPTHQPRLVQDAAWDPAVLVGPLRVAITARRDGQGVQQAEATARILAAGAGGAARPTRRAWYWDQAIDLLDRLCDVPDAPRTRQPRRRAGTAQPSGLARA